MGIVIDDELSTWRIILYYTSSIGGFIGIFICGVLLIHVGKHYYHKFYSTANIHKQSDNQRKEKILLNLFIVYLVSSFIICILYAFIRSNTFTQIDVSSWTIAQCAIGYYGSFGLVIFNKLTIMYPIFLYRIKLAFQGTAYQYPSWVFKTFWIILVIQCIIFQILFFYGAVIGIKTSQWELHTFLPTNMTFCGGSNDYHLTLLIALGLGALSEFINTLILLYMFIKKLRALHIAAINQYITEINKYSSTHHENTINIPSDTRTRTASVENTTTTTTTSGSGDVHTHSPDIQIGVTPECVGDVQTESVPKRRTQKEQDAIDQVVMLRDLMKKQTVLVSIALCSTMILWLLSLLSTDISKQVCWDIIINSVCLWLTFGYSEKYWIWCKKYFICWCCYNCKICKNSSNQIV